MLQPGSPLYDILDLARWAPSGDNAQPWRFEIVGEHHVVVHGFDTREHCVYDLDGHASQLALGALLETLTVAASGHGLRAGIERREGMPETQPTFDVRFSVDAEIHPDPLLSFITQRTVQRRRMRTALLSPAQKEVLDAAAGSTYSIVWMEGISSKLRAARLMFDNARIRLTIPEAYAVHRAIIEWNARFSEDKVPDQALGLDPVTLRLMRWVMASWGRVEFFNTFLAGTLAPRIQLDFIPGLACAAHFALVAKTPPITLDDYVMAGRAVQRFWLTATRLGLKLQPEMTPVIFGRYVREGKSFTRSSRARESAAALTGRLSRLLGVEPLQRVVFLGRIGFGPSPSSRSLRLALPKLLRS